MLTPAQDTALKNYVITDPVLNQLQPSSDAINTIVTALNTAVNPDFFVLATNVPIVDIKDNVLWAKFTPNDPPDNTVTYQNRALICQLKLEILQTILSAPSGVFDAGKATQVQGLNDCLTNLPAGVNGATISAGWAAVKTALNRKATVTEKLFATGAGTAANPATMSFEGQLSYPDVLRFMQWG